MSPYTYRPYAETAEAERLERIEMARQLTLARLTACHGAARAASIMAGTDTAANADIAAWRNLGVGKP